MTLKERILEDFKKAFKEKNDLVKGVLALVKSEINNEEINAGKREEGLDDDGVIAVLKRMVKQRKDSIQQYKDGGRPELAEGEEKELAILEEYLPEQMGEEELEEKVKAIVEKSGATSKADMGKVMGMAMGELKGQVDGDRVKAAVEKILE